MSRYIDADEHLQKLRERRDTAIIWEINCNDEATKDRAQEAILIFNECISELINAPTADVVEADKVQKEIDYWHDKAQSYEQTILKLALNKADVVEVVRCRDCVYYQDNNDVYPPEGCKWRKDETPDGWDFCSEGERI